MNYLQQLENKSIYILREAFQAFPDLCVLWSMGKDSTVVLWLLMKAFLGKVPIPVVHIDTGHKIPEMIAYRDYYARQWALNMLLGRNDRALGAGQTFPNGVLSHLQCCHMLKTEALNNFLRGLEKRYRLNNQKGEYEVTTETRPYTAVIVGIRADEEGSRSKERYFSPRGMKNDWVLEDQPPEFWHHYNSEFAEGTHIRIHPLLSWTEIDIWEYIKRENIPVSSLYFDQGDGLRYRSLGCAPCTKPILSQAKNVDDIIYELRYGALASVAERSGRAQDKEDGGGLEGLRRKGYM